MNWKRFKKKVNEMKNFEFQVSFRHQIGRSGPPVQCTKTKSLSLDFHRAIPITNIHSMSNGSSRNVSHERPPLQKQRRKSSDTVLEIDADDLL
ncbi:unnamed protein product [Heligmosomoides polygyrus]|uniref:Uncharacterized protein n=1 Tax=Heligmosomoides polygyrus TaxID=6339 RepID=A0A3P7UAR9_HELPZ|nr:unnamed protein product [Heligmosomoides polygyrus]